jgi:BirA family biotin operon repressor/biotin-[acetyl-CoA-carboxylase] ligase
MCGASRTTSSSDRPANRGQDATEMPLSSCGDDFDLAHLRREATLHSAECHAELGSTNDLAVQRIRQGDIGVPHLILAQRQTAGRGRGTNRWWSASGALTFSLIIDPGRWSLPPARWPALALSAGLAVCDALRPLVPPGTLGLKWPNDVYLAGRKLCGILVELPSQQPPRAVVGVGINVNNSLRDAPPEIRQRATSLYDELGRPTDRCHVLLAWLRAFAARCSWLPTADDLAEQWRAYCLLSGCNVEIQLAPPPSATVLRGRCLGIAPDGALLLHDGQQLHRVHSGTVVHFSPDAEHISSTQPGGRKPHLRVE